MAAAATAAAGASGMRAWLAARGFSWVTPRGLRWMTGTLLGLALATAAVGFG
jgi:hypothetical protein